MASRAFSRILNPSCTSILIRDIIVTPIAIKVPPSLFVIPIISQHKSPYGFRYHRSDGRPKGPLCYTNKLISKEALFAILGVKRFIDNEEKLDMFIKYHVIRLLKRDKLAVFNELYRQKKPTLVLKMFKVIQKEDWYKPDRYLYKDLIIALILGNKIGDAMEVWEDMKKEEIFPDYLTYTKVMKYLLRNGSPADVMNIYEDMKKSPDRPHRLPFQVLLKAFENHPLLRKKVQQDFDDLVPNRDLYDRPEAIFGSPR